MVSSSKVRIACPLISFLFACLGASLGVSHNFVPLVRGFVFESSSLSVALADFLPLLRQSLDWFEGLMSGQEAMSEVRSSKLETELSSSDKPVEGDTSIFVPREIRAFHALEEVYGLDGEILSRFRNRFQFLDRVRARLPREEERAYHFLPGEVCFYEAAFLSGLRFPIHPFLMELLGRFGIIPGQFMPNSWRIVVSCMEIWLVATNGNMIEVDELVYLYCLKESKEYRYYKLVPWERRTRIVRDLPSSFRYWKSRFFFMSRDD